MNSKEHSGGEEVQWDMELGSFFKLCTGEVQSGVDLSGYEERSGVDFAMPKKPNHRLLFAI